MTHVDWSVLSGPRVSRRTMLKVAAATGSIGFAQRWEALAAAAPTLAPASQEATPGGTLKLGYSLQQILSLDPAQVTQGIVAGELVANLFSSLVQFDENLGLIADLAETWDVAPDGKQYTFHLRRGLKHHNGDALVAEDFLYTHKRTTNPDFASPHANKLALISEITAPDEQTVLIKLSQPYAPFLATACSRGPGRALTPISKRAAEELGDEKFGLSPVGCGPFKIVPETVEAGKGFEMVAFEEWYGGRPFLDKIVVQLIPEESSQISALEAGDVDMLDIAPLQGVAQLKENGDLTVIEAPGTNWIGLTMNFKRPPWDKPEARMAVSKAIDRDDFIKKAVFGLGTPSVGAIAPAFSWAYMKPEDVDNPQAFDLEQAKTLAEQSGLNGTKASLLATQDTRAAEVLRNQLKEIGLDIQVELLQNAAWNERWEAGDFDMLTNGSVVDADPDDGHWNFFQSEGPWNTYGYKSAKADELLASSRSTADQATRAQAFQQLQTELEKDVAYAFLYHYSDFVAFYSYVKGYTPIPEMRYMEKVWLDK